MRKSLWRKLQIKIPKSLINFDIAHKQAVEEIIRENNLEISDDDL